MTFIRNAVAAVAMALFLLAAMIAEASAETCIASWYQSGHTTASGGHVGARTAAHRSYPFGAVIRVKVLATGIFADLTVNDRGPFVRGRCVDVSAGGAHELHMRGTALVSVERIR